MHFKFLRKPHKNCRGMSFHELLILFFFAFPCSLPLLSFHALDKVKQSPQCYPSMHQHQRNICVTLSAVNKHGSEVLTGYKQKQTKTLRGSDSPLILHVLCGLKLNGKVNPPTGRAGRDQRRTPSSQCWTLVYSAFFCLNISKRLVRKEYWRH